MRKYPWVEKVMNMFTVWRILNDNEMLHIRDWFWEINEQTATDIWITVLHLPSWVYSYKQNFNKIHFLKTTVQIFWNNWKIKKNLIVTFTFATIKLFSLSKFQQLSINTFIYPSPIKSQCRRQYFNQIKWRKKNLWLMTTTKIA